MEPRPNQLTGEVLEETTCEAVGMPILSKTISKIIPALCKARQTMVAVGKNGYNEKYRYNYRKADDIYDAIGKTLAENEVMLIPSVMASDIREVGKSRNDNSQYMTEVRLAIMMVHSSGESITQFYHSTAMDIGDKGIFKAYTGALKYHLLMTFLIGGDDAENENGTGEGTGQGRRGPGQRGAQRPPAKEQSEPGSVSSMFINNEQFRNIEVLIIETGTDEKKFLEAFKVASLDKLPAVQFDTAIKALKLKKAQQEAGKPGSSPARPASSPSGAQGDITKTLKARNIPFEVVDGEIVAKPAFADAGAREFLKSCGFLWDSKGKAWKHAA